MRTSLDTTKSTALPHTTGNELERTSRNLLTSSRNTNNDALTPSLVARLKRSTHNINVTRAIKRVVAATIRHLNELLLDRLVTKLSRVDKVCGAEFLGPFLFCVVDVDYNNHAGLVLGRALDDGQTDAASAEDGDVAALLDTVLARRDDGSAVAGGDSAAEQAGAVHGGVFLDGDDGDVGYNCVLGEGGCAHEVEEVLALAAETRCAVRHDALSLCGADLSAEVRLAGFAKLAFFAFGGAS